MGARLLLQPLTIVGAYLAFTLILYQFGPIPYPTQNRLWLLLYLAALLTLLGVAYLRAVARPAVPSLFGASKIVLVGGGLASVIVLFPSAWAYTAYMPWDVLSAFQNQNRSYLGLSEQLAATEGARNWVIALRVLTQPLTYAALPLGIIYWRRSNLAKFAAVAAATSALIFSVLRGTDREVADLIIIGVSAIVIARARSRIAGEPVTKLPLKKIFGGLAVVLALITAYQLFSDRKSDRMGTLSAFCLGVNSGACVDYDHPSVAALPVQQKFAVAMATGYFTNGYYGLQLALSKPWEPTWGLGHSAGLRRLSELVTGESNVTYRTYEYRNRDDGWPGEYMWASSVTALANDVSFWGAALVFGVFGFVWGRSWVSATFGFSDPAAVVFCLSMHTLFYFSANLQVLLTLEGYATVITWLIVWGVTSRARA